MRTAVLLYGFTRTYKTTSKSLLTNIIEPNNADIFIATYDNEGLSVINETDINRSKKDHSCNQDKQGNVVTFDTLKEVYGDRLVGYHIETYNENKFIEESTSVNSPILPIHRFFSLYYNISKVAEIMKEYEEKNKINYDCIFIMRPDLLIYNKVYAHELDLDAINIPSYGGNIDNFGRNQIYKVCSYRNIERLEYIPFESVNFTDQFIVSSYKNLHNIHSLYSRLQDYNSYGIPLCHPETTLYYHLAYSNKLDIKLNDFQYEILRSNYRIHSNTFDTNRHPQFDVPAAQLHKQSKREKYKERLINDFINLKQAKSILTNLFKFIVYYSIRR